MIRVEIPDDLHAAVLREAEREGITDGELISHMVAEAMQARMFFAPRVRRVHSRVQAGGRTPRQLLLDALDRVPDVEPDPHDRLD